MLDCVFSLFAQAAGSAPAPAGGADGPPGATPLFQMMLYLGVPLLLGWVLIIRPAQKQEKERKKGIYTIKKGDDVTFSGGILGTVAGIKEKTPGTPGDNDEITVKVLDSKLRILRSSIYAFTAASESDAKETTTA